MCLRPTLCLHESPLPVAERDSSAMRAFIIRPFGEKDGIDFDRIERELIQPALRRLCEWGIPIEGGTTGEINRAGNIREDMFRLLVVSDLVIADVSIHNANAFYELGIRHALRPRHTFMIRSKGVTRYPFDLQTDRYLLYDADLPGETVSDLAAALRSTLASPGPSSPVFELLPNLVPHPRGQLVRVPSDFAEDVDRARIDRQLGRLRLIAEEVRSFEWDQEGLRLVGDAQFKLRANAGAKETFEALRAADPNDLHANLRLGTIYQRLSASMPPASRADTLARSDQAIARALGAATSAAQRAEAWALLASNAKSRWMDEFLTAPPETRRSTALRSAHLPTMVDLYIKAAGADLNAHYPAVHALALLHAQIALAEQLPADWAASFDSDDEANGDLERRKRLSARLVETLTLALEMDELMGKREGVSDPWMESSRADLLMFATQRPQRVAQAYRRALSDTDDFTLEAVRRSLGAFRALGLFEPNLSAALEVVDEAIAAADPPAALPGTVVLFTGHMIDTDGCPADRTRFPRTKAAELKARRLIEDALRHEMDVADGTLLGIAGGACGSDILFHELCRDLGIPCQLFLALPPDQFQVTSVQHAGPDWVERYRALTDRLAPQVLQERSALPDWLVDKTGYDLWQRNNRWMMFSALATEASHRTLIALYNPDKDPNGPGGTAHMVAQANSWGFKSVVLDARALLSP